MIMRGNMQQGHDDMDRDRVTKLATDVNTGIRRAMEAWMGATLEAGVPREIVFGAVLIGLANSLCGAYELSLHKSGASREQSEKLAEELKSSILAEMKKLSKKLVKLQEKDGGPC